MHKYTQKLCCIFKNLEIFQYFWTRYCLYIHSVVGRGGELTEQRICCNKSFVINIYLSFSLPTLTNSAGSNSIKPWVFLWIARRVSSVILVFSWSRLLLSRVVTVGSKVVNFLTLSSKYGTGPPRGVRQKNFWQFLKVGKTFSRFPALEEHNCLL